jgi:hypothetical protein
VLRRIFGPKRDEVAGEWRRLHIEELHDMYSSPYIMWGVRSRIMRQIWECGTYERQAEGAYMDLIGKREGNRQLGRTRCR